jgi:hypothetical protein
MVDASEIFPSYSEKRLFVEMSKSPVSDFDSHYEAAAIPELVQSAFVDTFWTAERTENFLNQKLIKMEQKMVRRGGANRSASIGGN